MNTPQQSPCSEHKKNCGEHTEAASIAEQFALWAECGRGVALADEPVLIEPPCRPFQQSDIFRCEVVDDGRESSFFTASVQKLGRWFRKRVQEEHPTPNKTQIHPAERKRLVEIQASLPPNLSVSKEQIEQFILSLAYCIEPVSFEIIGTSEQIVTQFATGEADADRFQQQVEANVPDAVFTRHNAFLESNWHEIKQAENEEAFFVDFGLSREFMFSIATGKNFEVDPLVGIVAALSKLDRQEMGVFQVLFVPTREPWRNSILQSVANASGEDLFPDFPELTKNAKAKVSRPLFAVVVRAAIQARTDDRILEISRTIAGALAVYSNPDGNELMPLENNQYPPDAHELDVLCRQSRRRGMILNVDELISLCHLPSASVREPKLKRETQKTKAAPEMVQKKDGLLLGINSHAGKETEVRLDTTQRIQHGWIIGASGCGKSTLLFNSVKQMIDEGQGVAIIDPHGDLAERIISGIPKHRIDDVILVDPSDPDYSVGFNVLSAHSELEKSLLASDLCSVFERLSRSWGDQLGAVLHNGLNAFLESHEGGTLADLQKFLIEPTFRSEFLKTVDDPQVLYYWKKVFPQLSGNKSIGPVLTRLSNFLDQKAVRCMVTQKENRLDFAQIMDTGKIFIAKLAQGQIGNENAFLLGSFFVSKFQQLAMSRQAQAANQRKEYFLVIDEFHNVMTPSMAQILNGARKYKLGLVLCHQELWQLQTEPAVASAVLANPYTRICFRVGDDDARKLANGFSSFDSKDIQHLPNFQAICRVERSDCDFTLSIPTPVPIDENTAAETRAQVIAASRQKYAVSRRQLETEHAMKFEIEAETPPKIVKRGNASAIPIREVILSPEQSQATEQLKSDACPLANTCPTIVNEGVTKETEVAVNKPKTTLLDGGRGGAQHKAIQHRLKDEAQKLGFGTTIEKEILEGQGSIDLFVERGELVFACEISFTTTIDHEVGNVIKCLKAGYRHVCVICTESTRLAKIQTAVTNCLPAEETAGVRYFQPDEFVALLRQTTIQHPLPSPPPETKVILGKYKVKTKQTTLDDEERHRKEQQIQQAMSETMKGMKKKKK